DAAAADPKRIYVTGARFVAQDGGLATRQGLLLRSDDAGVSWRHTSMAASSVGFDPYLSAIHPRDPEKLYVRLRGPDSDETVVNRVLYSADGGQSWQQIYEARADILGFALSPDGSRVALGLGDSRGLGGTRPVDKSVLGLYVANTADHQFIRTRP